MTPPALPGLLGMHHLAIAVRDLAGARDHHVAFLGATVELERDLRDRGVSACSLLLPGGRAGAPRIELVAPFGETSTIERFLERRGEGLHHVAWEVVDIDAALDACRAGGLRLIDEHAHEGLHGTPVAFLHPSAAGGVLTELVQSPHAR